MMEHNDEEWDIIEVTASLLDIEKNVADNLTRLLEQEECTIPFIARYRKEQTNNMDAAKLRMFSETLQELREVQKKASSMIRSIEKQGKLTPRIEKSLKSAQTKDELNHLFAPYKGDRKHSLADRARALGLEEAALSVTNNPNDHTNLRKWVVKGVEGRSTLSDVEKAVKYLIADQIAKHSDTLTATRKIFKSNKMILESKISTTRRKGTEENQSSSKKDSKKQGFSQKPGQDDKYHLYYDFRCPICNLKSYQILAINRGESQKQLTVKIIIEEQVENSFISWCKNRWVNHMRRKEMQGLVEGCIQDAYTRLIKPLVLRRTRTELTKSSHIASVEVFGRNLKKLLLTAPVRGKIVLGVDPGYKNGCKCAVVSATGNDVLGTDVFNLNREKEGFQKIKELHIKHHFEVVAIGNGTACRETEKFISQFIDSIKNAHLVYCIVNECGASIYSITEGAERELPNMDPNIRSAVSIARRLQDPLVELIKIEPKHLGVGMYQHDIPDTLLKTSLSCVVEDCVTFVGVDLNVANSSLLSRVAGLKPVQVQNILEWRKKNGNFINRQQLLEVPRIGDKTFQQCAGFMRISPPASNSDSASEVGISDDKEQKNDSFNLGRKRKADTKLPKANKKKKMAYSPDPLDQTWIHPESYDATRRFLILIGCDEKDIGKPKFISQIKTAQKSLTQLAEQLNVGVPTLQLITDGLAQPSGYRDVRQESSKPLYRRTLKSFKDLRVGDKIRGRITNVTDFGVFVDVGVGQDGLIHCSRITRWEEMKELLGPNDVITVLVKDFNRNKLSLGLSSYDVHSTKLE